MNPKPGVTRRHFLRAAGVSLALPWFESQAGAAPAGARPARSVFFFVPNGVNMWEWHPKEFGSDYRLTPPLAPLAPFRRDLTVFSGLQHFNTPAGHAEAAVWLTGNERYSNDSFSAVAPNTISVDQHIARAIGSRTRIPNLVVGSMGGGNTISFNAGGRAVAAESNLKRLFHDLLGTGVSAQRLGQRGSILDALRAQARALQKDLGHHDQQKLDEYLESVRAVEQRVRRDLRFALTDRPTVDEKSFALDADPFDLNTQGEYIRTMSELLILALQTDSTRIVAFQTCASDASGAFKFYSQFGTFNWHQCGHESGDLPMDQKPREFAFLSAVDKWWAEHFAHFLKRLRDVPDGDGNLLEQTMVLYGSGMSWPAMHRSTNLPIILAGGRRLGLRHGRHLQVSANLKSPTATRFEPGATSVSDLLRTISERMGVPAAGFGQSTRTVDELLA